MHGKILQLGIWWRCSKFPGSFANNCENTAWGRGAGNLVPQSFTVFALLCCALLCLSPTMVSKRQTSHCHGPLSCTKCLIAVLIWWVGWQKNIMGNNPQSTEACVHNLQVSSGWRFFCTADSSSYCLSSNTFPVDITLFLFIKERVQNHYNDGLLWS